MRAHIAGILNLNLGNEIRGCVRFLLAILYLLSYIFNERCTLKNTQTLLCLLFAHIKCKTYKFKCDQC